MTDVPGTRRWGSRSSTADIAIVVIVVMALVAVTTYAAWRALPSDDGPDLFVIGDSVTYLSAGSIQQQWDPSHLQIVAEPGFSSTALMPLVLKAMDQPHVPASARDKVAVLVGYNDVRLRQIDTPSLEAMVHATSKFHCGVWMTLPSRPGKLSNPDEFVPSPLVDQWNARLKVEVAKYPNLHLSHDWQDTVTRSPVGRILEPDGIHPNAAGQRRLADSFKSALDRHC